MGSTNAGLLIVDDNRDVRTVLGRLLKQQGYERVYEASDGVEALQAIAERDIDLVLLDCAMPEMDGYQVLERLKAQEALHNLPVIMISAHEGVDSVVKCIELGAEDYLAKPFDPVLLRTRVAASLEKKRLREVERTYLQTHDSLTGLANRALFLDQVANTLHHADRRGSRFAVVAIRVEGLAKVCGGLGVSAGDELILRTAERLERCMRSNGTVARADNEDIVARIGSHEFAILLRDLVSETNVNTFVERILSELAEPVTTQGHRVVCTATAGIAFGSAGYGRSEDLLRDAALAASRAEEGGMAHCAIFDADMHARVQKSLALESELRQALNRDELCLFYQPIICLKSGTISGFEALLRWRHPHRGLVSPLEFIPLAEETGLIVPIGSWVLREACRQAALWRDRFDHARELSMSVNVSGAQFTKRDFVPDVRNALGEYGPVNLKLEITETVVMDSPERTADALEALKELGLEHSIDDFGTGYSSLSYLYRFPFATLKIDRSFIHNMEQKKECREIVQALIPLAHALNIDVVAEGVETPEDMRFLQRLSCDYAQGYLFARPIEPHAIEKLLAEWPRWDEGGGTACAA